MYLYDRFWRHWLGWLPVQSCLMCGKWFWAGLPWFGIRDLQWQWWPAWSDYCSKGCCDEDLDFCDEHFAKHDGDVADEVPMLPEGCGYMGHDFGATYLDSECFGGQLYDLDNGEGGMLNEPHDYLACPNCRMEEWLEREAEMISEGISGWEKSSLPHWKRICRYALKLNRDEAMRLLSGRFNTVSYVDMNEDAGDYDEHKWLFDESQLDG